MRAWLLLTLLALAACPRSPTAADAASDGGEDLARRCFNCGKDVDCSVSQCGRSGICVGGACVFAEPSCPMACNKTDPYACGGAGPALCLCSDMAVCCCISWLKGS